MSQTLFHLSIFSLSLCLLLSLSAAQQQPYDPAPPLYAANAYTSWTGKFEKSRVADISVPITGKDGLSDSINMKRLDLVGDQRARGRAHGALLAKEIVHFLKVKLPIFYTSTALTLDLSKFPEPLQKILTKKIALNAADAFNDAMWWVYERELSNIPSALIDEMEGIADGLCSVLGAGCNSTEWAVQIKTVNMLPELIRMACTAYGAWGKASSSGSLLQTRALDFGSGPWSNYTVIVVHRDADMRPFVMVGFPAFVGAITGIAKDGIAISEKVWMVDGMGLQPGNFKGEPDVFVLRDILQYSSTRAEAEAYVKSVNRTWAIFIGVGDFATQKFDIIGYKEDSATVYTDASMPAVTEQPYIDSVCYVDKHPQPSWDEPANGQYLPTALGDFYGNINAETSRQILEFHETGDVHIAIYDFGAKEMHVSIGRVDGDGNYISFAYERPYVRFVLDDLWSGA